MPVVKYPMIFWLPCYYYYVDILCHKHFIVLGCVPHTMFNTPYPRFILSDWLTLTFKFLDDADTAVLARVGVHWRVIWNVLTYFMCMLHLLYHYFLEGSLSFKKKNCAGEVVLVFHADRQVMIEWIDYYDWQGIVGIFFSQSQAWYSSFVWFTLFWECDSL